MEPEPFGRVAAESMIMGVPVIAAAGSGAGEYVEAARAGITTPPRNLTPWRRPFDAFWSLRKEGVN